MTVKHLYHFALICVRVLVWGCWVFVLLEGARNRNVEELNKEGWNLLFIHSDTPNLLIWTLPLLIFAVTLGLRNIGSRKRLVFEKDTD